MSERGWMRGLMVGLVVLGVLAGHVHAERMLGTVGPPPRQSPQRETAAEGFPPLPLPVVPLRRSEPKSEPQAPTFIARLAYGETQDYMPNPGDLANLLGHVRTQLDVWYGHTIVQIDELVAMHAEGQRYEVPVIYMTGYEAFRFTDAQRAALRDYLLDGGTLLADATLGSRAFVASFEQEMAAMFPQRQLREMQVDHPVFRGYYEYDNVQYFRIGDGAATRFASPPQMYGLNIAARTAVILSPFDMTCGWDEFYAPAAPRRGEAQPEATLAMMPSDAIRMGINLVAYAAAERNFAQAQATTSRVAGEQAQRRARVSLGLVRHQGDWNPDPNALYQWIRLAAMHTSVPVAYEYEPVDATVGQIADHHVLVMTGMADPELDEQELDALRRHVLAGGVLIVNNTSGFAAFDRAARAMIEQLLPEHGLERAGAEHAVYRSLHEIESLRKAGTGRAAEADLEIVELDGRAVVIYAPTDMLALLKGIHDPYANAWDAESARMLALNVLCYVLEH